MKHQQMGLCFHGISIGKLHVTWLDLWTKNVGLWVEWDNAPRRLAEPRLQKLDCELL